MKLRALGLAGLVALCASSSSSDVDACGGFFRPPTVAGRLPSLSHEQALIVFDNVGMTEHFVREVTFRDATTPFGFVVPTPSKPTISKIDRSPFATLNRVFEYYGGLRLGSGGGAVQGGSKGGPPGGAPAVTVLEVKKVGSFTSFTLQATDAKALADWLSKNQLVSTPEADAWLDHYVKMKFFYVALRYDPPKDGGKVGVQAETIDISFGAALPYYPYFEPARRADAASDPLRLLEVWLLSNGPLTYPVAFHEENGKREWVRPLGDGRTYEDREKAIRAAQLDPAIEKMYPDPRIGKWNVQTFQDQKVSRAGYGDIVFVPRTPVPSDPVREITMGALADVLDPSLLETK